LSDNSAYISIRPEIRTGFLDSRTQEVHVTLAYLPEVDDFWELVALLEDQPHIGVPWVEGITAYITGMASWIVPEGYAQVATLSTPGNTLHYHQGILVNNLWDWGYYVSDKHPFVPHITMDYSDEPFTRLPALHGPIPVELNNLYVGNSTHGNVKLRLTEDGHEPSLW
jgi:2'-5' RNA ligase